MNMAALQLPGGPAHPDRRARRRRVEHCTIEQLRMGLVVQDRQPPALWISNPVVWVVSFARLVPERMP
jgi:hypothetical protein